MARQSEIAAGSATGVALFAFCKRTLTNLLFGGDLNFFTATSTYSMTCTLMQNALKQFCRVAVAGQDTKSDSLALKKTRRQALERAKKRV